jgi:Xaa-Pro dipeptidase
MEAGSTMFYFTGTRQAGLTWILPARGEPVWVAAAGTDASKLKGDVRTGAYPALAQALKERGAAAGTVGLEEQVRFGTFLALRQAAAAAEFASATPVTAGCRMVKSATELALMQHATDVTIAAYKAGLATLYEGMPQNELSANISAAYQALGFRGYASAEFGMYTAYPHGSSTPQKLREGDVVMIDDGCAVDGYQSDVTRTVVFGQPTDRQRQIWDLEKKAQTAAFRAARPGVACEAVDAAARKVITDAGFGPDYKVPGLPHRTGHGIGLDGHEWTHFVRGNTTKMQPGMCFSDEPTISIYGEFGVRLEDCLHITENGARFFSRPSPSIDQPFG